MTSGNSGVTASSRGNYGADFQRRRKIRCWFSHGLINVFRVHGQWRIQQLIRAGSWQCPQVTWSARIHQSECSVGSGVANTAEIYSNYLLPKAICSKSKIKHKLSSRREYCKSVTIFPPSECCFQHSLTPWRSLYGSQDPLAGGEGGSLVAAPWPLPNNPIPRSRTFRPRVGFRVPQLSYDTLITPPPP